MKVSLSWLKSHVDITASPAALADSLTMLGLEVDSVSDRYAYLASVLVGRVTSVRPHPNADKLVCCEVDLGDKAITVVCGAPNVREGMLSAAALPGTELPDGRVLQAGTIRGVASEGMLCSEKELGLGTDGGGIMELDGGLPVGGRLDDALALSDTVFDIDLTPNRPDCLSILGVAREIAALQQGDLRYPRIELPETDGDIHQVASVTIEAPAHCPRYTARLVEDVTVKPSPRWLQDRLLSVGQRPINNLVDVTNFVLMELGQPLHAFDFDRLAGHRIVVRTAYEGEPFVTLDEKQRTLAGHMLMICDGEKPVGVAGVMGGMNSEISSDTTRVLIESACFDPASIRKTAKALGLNTEASHRFERGVDPDGTLRALNRAAQLIAELGEGRLVGGTIDEHPRPRPERKIPLSVARTNRFLGTAFDGAEIADILSRLAFDVTPVDADRFSVAPPSFRVDVERPEDLMEEIARMAGYNRIPTTYPLIPARGRQANDRLAARNRLKGIMVGFGFHEIVSYSFVHSGNPDRLSLAADDPRRSATAIVNPLSEDQAVMRTSLVPGLLETMQRNMARQVGTIRIFETGKVFLGRTEGDLPEEREMLGALWSGLRQDASWHGPQEPCDFFDLKGILEGVLSALHLPRSSYTALEPAHCDYLQPGQAAGVRLDGAEIARIGRVHPKVQQAFNLRQPAYLFELNLETIYPRIPDTLQAEAIPRFPSISRDATLIIDRHVEAAGLLDVIRGFDDPLVEELTVFDVFEGDPIAAGKKSVSFRIVYRSGDGTLDDETVNARHKGIVERVIKTFGADLPA